MASLHSGWFALRRYGKMIFEKEIRDGCCRLSDPIWLVASVEEGGLLGITQQLDQCHSLGMNPHSTMNYSSYSMTGVPSVVTANPFQSQRCKPTHDRRGRKFDEFFCTSGSNPEPGAASNPGWTNYPLIPVNVSEDECSDEYLLFSPLGLCSHESSTE